MLLDDLKILIKDFETVLSKDLRFKNDMYFKNQVKIIYGSKQETKTLYVPYIVENNEVVNKLQNKIKSLENNKECPKCLECPTCKIHKCPAAKPCPECKIHKCPEAKPCPEVKPCYCESVKSGLPFVYMYNIQHLIPWDNLHSAIKIKAIADPKIQMDTFDFQPVPGKNLITQPEIEEIMNFHGVSTVSEAKEAYEKVLKDSKDALERYKEKGEYQPTPQIGGNLNLPNSFTETPN